MLSKYNGCLKFRATLLLLLFFLFMFNIPLLLAAQPDTLLILPFNINSQESKVYLQHAMADMLESQLTDIHSLAPIQMDSGADIISKTPGRINQSRALILAQTHGSDWVVFGSMTFFNKKFSTDGFLINVKGKKVILAHHQTGIKESELMEHAAKLSHLVKQQIHLTTQGVLPPTSNTAIATSATPVTTIADISPPLAREQNPNNTNIHSTITLSSVVMPPILTSQNTKILRSSDGQPSIFRKSKPIPGKVIGIGAGDVDGDNQKDIVCISPETLTLYHLASNGLQQVATFKKPSRREFLRIEMADINQNGLMEIFIITKSSGFNDIETLALEWKNGKFIKIQDKIPYGVASVAGMDPGGAKKLYGQKTNFNNVLSENNPIFEITWNQDHYEPNTNVTLPFNANIFGYTQIELPPENTPQLIKYNPENHLIYNNVQTGDNWESDGRYGLTNIFVEKMKSGGSQSHAQRFYLYQRILPFDWNGDGKTDIVVAGNTDTTGTLFARTRRFKKGRMECLAWGQSDFSPLWQSKSFKGYFSDHTLVDINNDGNQELIAANVVPSTKFFSKSRSYLMIWSLGMGMNNNGLMEHF